MNTAAKLGSYALGLAVVFGGALGVGKATAVSPSPAAAAPATKPAHATEDAAINTPGGLQVSQDGYTLDPTTPIATGAPADFTFRIIGPDGGPVTGYEVAHDKSMHLIVASRDLTSFQHVHPEMAPDGTWSVKLAVPEAGPYRAFADFVPKGGQGLTLGADLQAAGDYRPRPLPQAGRTATVGDYTVSLAGDLVAGRSSKVTLTVSKGGEPVTDLQPYLGAYGHLVALRAGDLAYLHVHPEESAEAGPEITFYVEAPSRGDYRLFLDFQHGGEVRTAAFTATATPGDGDATPHGRS
ncbi:hypothetical protein [Nonomuraea aridisoli]|uniref:Secreted protein n=1 Tax=Nonomuraea aridisoli TaxID=2070368 RepID=A0A2W2G1Z5_9ACTN|nr:hypothetical protein [Nonomuraea aridisoli]PZG20914.1 hypothetical protein C1J01_07900 [Nonomuraea aridisoli]